MEELGEDYEALPEMHLEGKILADRYRIVRRIGDGGMATVYLAEHTSIEKQCAIKVLNIAYAHQQEAVDRFLREARAASRIQHENIVDITDFGRAPNGSVFFVMELLAGEDLATTVRREGAMPWPRVRHFALQISRALAAAHARGIVHRDLKPENCFRVTRGGDPDFIKVLDFGIARVATGSLGERALTSAGTVFGTPAYMSPEQCDGRTADARSDVYALGCVMFELLTGRPPFMADTPLGYLKQHSFDEPPALRAVAPRAGIPERVEALVLQALAKQPEARFPGMEALATAIEAVDAAEVVLATAPEPEPRGRARWPRLAVALAAVVLATGIGVALAGRDPPPPEPTPRPAPPVAEPAPPSPPEPAPPAEVAVKVLCNVDAEVVDAASGEVLGRTGSALLLPRSDAVRSLLVRAPQYGEEALQVTPNGDQAPTVVLRKLKAAGGAKKKPGKGDNALRPINPFSKKG
ncbi:MAG: serine/threonine protein kinase [Myxococcales bacterium]|nr:serine/threonine protein kinase [Myxococcales bacterium]